MNARNPLNIATKSGRRTSSSSSSSSTASAAAKLAATNAAAATAAAASTAAPSGNSNSTSNSNGGTATLATSTSTSTSKDKDKDKDPLKAFRSLLGLSPAEAREVYSKAEAEGGGGQAALQKELARRKGAYIRLVLTVAPCLGMTHANPGLQHEVREPRPAGVFVG